MEILDENVKYDPQGGTVLVEEESLDETYRRIEWIKYYLKQGQHQKARPLHSPHALQPPSLLTNL